MRNQPTPEAQPIFYWCKEPVKIPSRVRLWLAGMPKWKSHLLAVATPIMRNRPAPEMQAVLSG
jgi:hypothetical protein